MILTDYYRFERVATKSKTRMDCTLSTHSYPEFEERTITRTLEANERRDAVEAGQIIVYLTSKQFGGDPARSTDRSISIKSKNLSSVYVTDPRQPYAYGDFRGTTDALLIVFNGMAAQDGCILPGAVMEVFVARGMAHNRTGLCNMLADGLLDDEAEALRKAATAARR